MRKHCSHIWTANCRAHRYGLFAITSIAAGNAALYLLIWNLKLKRFRGCCPCKQTPTLTAQSGRKNDSFAGEIHLKSGGTSYFARDTAYCLQKLYGWV
jgi:hypothetical protein